MTWHLESPASGLFVQSFVQVHIKEKSNLRVTDFVMRIHRLPMDFPHKWHGKYFPLMTSSWNTMKLPHIITLNLWCYLIWSLDDHCFVNLIHSRCCLGTNRHDKRTYLRYNTLLLLPSKTVIIGTFYARKVLPTVWVPELRALHYIIKLNEWSLCPGPVLNKHLNTSNPIYQQQCAQFGWQ